MGIAAEAAPAKTPAIALLDGADAAQWQAWSKPLGWQVISAEAPAGAPAPDAPPAGIDARVQALAAAVETAVKSGAVDAARVYLAGRGDSASAVFYAISRIPDRWAAGVALGGDPQAAIDSERIFTANFSNTPVLWISSGPNDEAVAKKLRSEGLNLEWRAAGATTDAALFAWLAGHTRDEFPLSVDCETISPAFARCYWIQMTKFDAGDRNDVLPSTRLSGRSRAALDLGCSYKIDDPGPGLLVLLPARYSGPLKAGDRIVALDGRPIENAGQFAETMTKMTDERPAVVMVERGKDRVRVETRILLPVHAAAVSARVQASYNPEEKEILIVSRTATEMRVTVPPAWVPGDLNWNGVSLEDLKSPGCYLLTIQKELLHAVPCP
ncbi:MAG: hypothetical protein LAP87_28410 [Acidobacteriia bacterium]|nr:hypothetical protein [Terriglobia bacterium]